MLLTKAVKIKWNSKNRKWYESKGYKFTNWEDEFEVRIEDVSKGSEVEIEEACDFCGRVTKKPYKKYNQLREKNPTYKCKICRSENKKIIKHNPNNKRKLSYEQVYNTFLNNNKLLVSTKYISSNEPLEYICLLHPEEGIQRMTYANVYMGQGCYHCGIDKIKSKNRLSQEFVFNKFREKGLYPINNEIYIDVRTSIKFICEKHKEKGVQEMNYMTLIQCIHGCKYCGIEAISGSNNYNWKGGLTEVNNWLRGLLIDWKKESMKKCDYKCVVTGLKANGDFDIHHLISFNLIVEKVFKELNLLIQCDLTKYTDEELNAIRTLFLEENNKKLGIVLHPTIHKLFHEQYGYGNNTEEQFEKFKQKYINNKLLV